MTDFELHDALIRKLADGHQHQAGASEDAVFRLVAPDRLRRFARWAAMEYYGEQARGHFQCTGALSARTGRNPRAAFQSASIGTILDEAVPGSRESAERVADAVTSYLTADDELIRKQIAYWRDLVRYEAALFRVGLFALPPVVLSAGAPRTSPVAIVEGFEWDIPALLPALRLGQTPLAGRSPTFVVFSRDCEGRISASRATAPARRVLELADGVTSLEALAAHVGYTPQRMSALTDVLRKIGALV